MGSKLRRWHYSVRFSDTRHFINTHRDFPIHLREEDVKRILNQKHFDNWNPKSLSRGKEIRNG